MTGGGPLGIGIVGCGVIGVEHARAARTTAPGAQLVAVTDQDRERAEKLAVAEDVDIADDLSTLLARDDVDIVSVCVPTGAHAETAMAALATGRHVIVEKPVDVTLAAADALIAARDAAGRQAMVISQRRFEPASVVVHDAVAAGRFGRLTSAHAGINLWRSQGYYDSGGWRGTWLHDGGGALMNQGIHTLDLLCWLLGEPVEVFGYADRLAHERIEVEDTAVASVRFASGAVASVLGTTAAYPGLTAVLRVHGSRGSAVIEDDRLAYFHAAGDADDADGAAYGMAGAGNQADGVVPAAAGRPGRQPDAHGLQYRDFVDAIDSGRPPLVTLEDGRRALRLILAIYESARTGRPVRCGEAL